MQALQLTCGPSSRKRCHQAIWSTWSSTSRRRHRLNHVQGLVGFWMWRTDRARLPFSQPLFAGKDYITCQTDALYRCMKCRTLRPLPCVASEWSVEPRISVVGCHCEPIHSVSATWRILRCVIGRLETSYTTSSGSHTTSCRLTLQSSRWWRCGRTVSSNESVEYSTLLGAAGTRK